MNSDVLIRGGFPKQRIQKSARRGSLSKKLKRVVQKVLVILIDGMLLPGLILGSFPQITKAAPVIIYLTSTTATTWVVPSDWNSSNNSIEVIGGGGGGGGFTAGSWSGSGGGGGGYSKITNLSLTPSASVTYSVGSGGAAGGSGGGRGGTGGDTYFCNSTANCG